MKKFVFIIGFFLLVTLVLRAQEGIPFISYYEGSTEMETGNWAIAQDKSNMMIFANKRGLLTYDGFQWEQVPFFPTLTCMEREPESGDIYVGAENDYGLLEKTEQGGLRFRSLLGDTANPGLITNIVFTDTTVIFYSGRSISVHQLNNLSDNKRWFSDEGSPFTGLIAHSGKLFFNVYGNGLFRIDSDTLFPLVTGYLTGNREILFSFPYNDGMKLIGTSDNKLQLFDRIMYYDYEMDNPEYLEENILSGAVMISDSLIALTTLYGGIMLIDKMTGSEVAILNYQNGLPDDEIYCARVDNNGGLWITHRYGVCRVDLRLPVSSFNHYTGLDGVVITILKHEGTLYAGTNVGLYFLDQISEYDDVDVLYRIPPSENGADEADQGSSGEGNRPVMRFFNRLFSNEDNRGGADNVDSEEDQEDVQYGKRTVKVLRTINYLYRKIEGINSSVSQTVAAGEGFITVSSAGIYYVEDNEATLIPTEGMVNSVSYLDENHFLVSSDYGLSAIGFEDGKWTETDWSVKVPMPVNNAVVIDSTHIWLGSENTIYRVTGRLLIDSCTIEEYGILSGYPVDHETAFVGDTVFALSEDGIYIYDSESDTFVSYSSSSIVPGRYYKYLMADRNELLVRTTERWQSMGGEDNKMTESVLRLFEDPGYISNDEEGSMWVVDRDNMIYRISGGNNEVIDTEFSMFVAGVNGSSNTYYNMDQMVFDPDEKAITVNIRAPYYLKETSTIYQYKIDELMDEWSDWNISPRINLFLKPGEYIVRFRAMNILGEISGTETVSFTIKKPFTQSVVFFFMAGLVVAGMFVLIIIVREKKLRHDKKVLEDRVRRRTEEISRQKEHIECQRDEIIHQKEEITSSITYASRIQTAMLPDISDFPRAFKDWFILFKPRDIVSGDFYWIAGNDDFVYFTAADCTGHGVPGAFMSMLGISLLNEITGDGKYDMKPSEVLRLLRNKVIMSLSHSRKGDKALDGMDIAFCRYKIKERILEYSGAFNPLYHFRNGQLTSYKADRMPVGYYIAAAEEFTNYEIQIEEDDVIYIFSDGMADQFGGPDNKKYGIKNLRADLEEVVKQPMDEQQKLLNGKFEKWRDGQNQLDDVILMGVKF